MRGFRIGHGAAALMALCAQPSWAATVANPGFETGTVGWALWSDPSGTASTTASGASSGSYGLVLWSSSAYRSDASQTLTGLPAGQYTLTAMFKNSGGQTAAYLYAKNCGGAARWTSIPVSASATRVVVRGVQVAGGSCTIGVWTEAGANQWVAMDDVTFVANTDAPYTFLQGGDISRLSWIESLGAKFYQDGVQKDPLQILADNGANFVRLRAYNDPGNPCCSHSNEMPPGIEDTADILALAARAKAKGLGIQLTLNYSDWWADSALQDVPHQWLGQSFAQIKTSLYNYTYDIVRRMVNQGTPPAMVSLGNQMQQGLLLTNGGYYAPATPAGWAQLAELLNAGSQAVKAASPTSKVMLHLDSPASAYDFFNAAVSHGVQFDVIGVSWYPYWEVYNNHPNFDTLPELLLDLNWIAGAYNKDIVIMETATNWSPTRSTGNYPGQLQNNGNVPYAQTPAGQRDYYYDLVNVCKNVDSGRCAGIQWWDPIAVNQPGFGWKVGGDNQVDNSTVFDWNHNALPVLTQGFKNNR